ncbi:MAG TPA: Flp family type IVb pilin [Candidatus Acidoferrales bacterium]|jgi:Flp pilus assembly pilin Flp|nr:Flp family type IVb pilin [Candidatus Acidoferrales bacterium]
MTAIFHSMIREEEGATMVEYALLLSFVALVVILSAAELGKNLDKVFDAARNAIRGRG